MWGCAAAARLAAAAVHNAELCRVCHAFHHIGRERSAGHSDTTTEDSIMRRAPIASGTHRLLTPNRSPAVPDAAEMGTAYGMEMSLEAPHAVAAAANKAAAQAKAGAKPAGGWLARLKRR
jgi:hypothetical protein